GRLMFSNLPPLGFVQVQTLGGVYSGVSVIPEAPGVLWGQSAHLTRSVGCRARLTALDRRNPTPAGHLPGTRRGAGPRCFRGAIVRRAGRSVGWPTQKSFRLSISTLTWPALPGQLTAPLENFGLR